MNKKALFSLLICCSPATFAGTFYDVDFSGVYECTGMDAKNGPFRGRLELSLNNEHSRREFGAYDIIFDGGDAGKYSGMAVSSAKTMSMYFSHEDKSTRDNGVGIFTMSEMTKGKRKMDKFYYQSEYAGGNTGVEECSEINTAT